MIKGKKKSAMLPGSWKKSFKKNCHTNKNRRCIESNDKILCDECNNQVNENKEFETNLNE